MWAKKADLTVYDLEERYNINLNLNEFVSMGKAIPFKSDCVYRKCKMTMCEGKEVFNEI